MSCVEPIRELDKIELVKKELKSKSVRDYLLFVMGINNGLRISDLLKLKVSDVKGKSHIEIFEQKTGKFRKFPITKSYKKALASYVKSLKDSSWLFGSKKGNKPISRVQAYRIIHKACIKAGINYCIGTHTLRKTFGYHFYKKTKDIALLQSILNHSTPYITLRYIGINQDIIDSSLKSFSL